MKPEKGTTFSHYKILSEIGKGGMREVYLAEDTELDRKVAIKCLSEQFSKDSDKLNRFVQEAKSAAALNDPSISGERIDPQGKIVLETYLCVPSSGLL